MGILQQTLEHDGIHATIRFASPPAFAKVPVSMRPNQALHLFLLVIGHTFIVAMEGLAAFVQTTRLVLFEFFVRFLKAQGRMFSPTTELLGKNGSK